MSFKKLSLAAAISIGIVSIANIANAQTSENVLNQQTMEMQQRALEVRQMALENVNLPVSQTQMQVGPSGIVYPQGTNPCPAKEKCPTGAAAPVATPCPVEKPCPGVTPCPCPPPAPAPCPKKACPVPQSTSGLMQPSVSATCPNIAPDADYVQTQVYAYPAIGSRDFTMPDSRRLVQIGGAAEASEDARGMSSVAIVPQGGCATGAAAPIGGCANQCGTNQCSDLMREGTTVGTCKAPVAIGTSSSATHTAMLQPQFAQGIVIQPQTAMIQGQTFPITGALLPSGIPVGAAAPVEVQIPVVQPESEYMFQNVPGLKWVGKGLSSVGDRLTDLGERIGLLQHPTITPGALSIQTPSSMDIQRTVMVPTIQPFMTGAAAPATIPFSDVPSNFWAGSAIARLASAGVITGYPDNTFKPNLPISRAELASIMITGLNLENTPATSKQTFSDVSSSSWANTAVSKAVNAGLMTGYPNGIFKPDQPITRVEALTSLSNAIPGKISDCDAQKVLGMYNDSQSLPSWANMPVAKALNAGLLKNFPSQNTILPNACATRADVASMMSQLRENLALAAPEAPTITGAAVNIIPQITSSTIPTLSVKFNDEITARASHVGDSFTANTLEPITINGMSFPQGSTVRGTVVEVVRPASGEHGAIKVAFDSVSNSCKQTVELPREILSATVVKQTQPNIVARALGFPFTLVGKVAGVGLRTLGGVTMVAGNATEEILNGVGIGTTELASGEIGASGRSYIGSVRAAGVGAYDIASTGVSGVVGVLRESADEVAFVAAPNGERITSINPNTEISVAFGCGACPQ